MSLGTMGMLLTLASIAAFFVALVIAYAIILGDKAGLHSIRMPGIFWVSTGLLVVSSASLQWAQWALRRAQLELYRKWLVGTMVVGYVFLVAQSWGAWVLLGQGVSVSANPQGNMYYVFCFIHGAHLLGGLGGMHWLWGKAAKLVDGEEQPLRKHRQAARLTGMYWHFMGLLWLGLFAFLLGWS